MAESREDVGNLIIDAHNHPNYLGFNCEKLLQDMEQNNIDQLWLLSLETPRHEYHPAYFKHCWPDGNGAIPFSSCLEFYRQHPDKFVLGYAPDPRLPESIHRLEAAIELYGVRVCGEFMLRMMYDNPDALKLFRFCGKRGLPVIVEVNYGVGKVNGQAEPWADYWYGGGIDTFERAIRACPDTTFLGHGPGFWAHIADDEGYRLSNYPKGEIIRGGRIVDMMRSYPNLYCDLSAGSGLNALERNPQFATEFLLEFQDRCLYGRDTFGNEHQQYLNSLGLPEEVLRKIYAGNASRLVD
ncbi:MAG: putative TIM-barrel fold metal-dependent hydrolase [Paenibacillus sp.]|nr:putative TIM-barrel fold metal-dependent hydrolase [Paenibacillus sp.]